MVPDEYRQYAPKVKPLKDGKQWNVFLSYRSVNRGWVLNLYDVLTALGYKVFLDQYVLKAGDELIFVLEQALAHSQAGILVWSGATADSDWVRKEYHTLETKCTSDKDFYFVTTKIDNAPLPGFANNKIFVDFSQYPDGPNGGDLLRLLYAIDGQPLSDEAVQFAYQQDEAAAVASAKINAAIRNRRPDKLIKLFDDGGLPWKTTAALGCKAAEGLTKLGNNNEAIAMLETIEKSFPRAVRPKQLRALALARRGTDEDLDLAQDLLGELYETNHLDPETMGIYGRTWMDRYNKSGDIQDLRAARRYYAEAFEKTPDDYYTGINAAAKSVFLGDLHKAGEYALQVATIIGNKAVHGDYWKTATIAEALLIAKKYAEAADMYQQAVDMAPTEKGSHQSTKKQAVKLLDKLGASPIDQQLITDVFA